MSNRSKKNICHQICSYYLKNKIRAKANTKGIEIKAIKNFVLRIAIKVSQKAYY